MLAAKRENMALANLRILENTKTTEYRARAIVKARSARFYNPITWPVGVCNGSYLDVDEILARSLPEVVSERVNPSSGKFFRRMSKALAAVPQTKILGGWKDRKVERRYLLEYEN